jgi:hypothetical protein
MLVALCSVAVQSTAAPADPWKPIGIPAAIVAVITLLSYLVGFIRPVRILQARYWTTGVGRNRVTELSCVVKNRKVNIDRTLTDLALIRVPSIGYRLFHWRWRRHFHDIRAYLLFGNDVAEIKKGNVKIAKRDERRLRCKVRGPNGHPLQPNERLPRNVRLMAYFGSSRPARFRPTHDEMEPSRS